MAQEQPERGAEDPQHEPIKYGDVFFVSGQMEDKPILPQDGAAMELAEKAVMGHSPIGGPASLMQSAASMNVQAGFINPNESDITDRIRVTQSEFGDKRIVTESVGDQMVGQYMEPKFIGVAPSPSPSPSTGGDKEEVTIGEALEAVVLSAGDQPIDRADAAAIEAAEKRALGGTPVPPSSGLGVQAHLAAAFNAQTPLHQHKTTLDDVLQDASDKLAKDKAVTREDAEEVVKAEIRNDPGLTTTIGGVGEMMVTAAKVNQP